MLPSPQLGYHLHVYEVRDPPILPMPYSPPHTPHAREGAPTLWGIDLGGTKVEGVIVDADEPTRVIQRVRVATESERGYDHIVGRIVAVVGELERHSGIERPTVIGVGTPGTTEPSSGALKNSNTVCLNGRPLGADLSRALGVAARLTNDANCFALAEATLGAARAASVVIGLILGTGVGSGIVIDGRVLTGAHGIAGEWGHNPMRGEATPCYCGRAGCVETVISGPALERFYESRTGHRVMLAEIDRLAAGGDIIAGETIDRLVAKFGEAIAAVLNILDPDAIVIGGGVGNIARLYSDETRAAIHRHLFDSELRTRVLEPALGASAGVFGAALLGR
jgi:N-acetylglucosamine kinase